MCVARAPFHRKEFETCVMMQLIETALEDETGHDESAPRRRGIHLVVISLVLTASVQEIVLWLSRRPRPILAHSNEGRQEMIPENSRVGTSFVRCVKRD
jgi:hypothetical protein